MLITEKAMIGKRCSDLIAVAEFIPFERIVNERRLMESKWYDYRFLSPAEATHLFAEAFTNIYRQKWQETFDYKEVKKRGLPKDIMKKGEFPSLWRARQWADAGGWPYDFFIRETLEYHLRRGWKKLTLPRPNQLFSEKHCEALAHHMTKRWAERCEARFTASKLPAYRCELFADHAAQRAHRDWVVNQIRSREALPFLAIGRAVCIERTLPEAMALEAFGYEWLERGKRDVEHETPEPTALGEPLLPSCFAIPGAYGDSCGDCPVAGWCRTLNGRVRAKIIEKHGSEDPVVARKRALGAARVRKHRAKAAAAAEMRAHASP